MCHRGPSASASTNNEFSSTSTQFSVKWQTTEYSQHSWRKRNFYRPTSNHLKGRYRNRAFNCFFHAPLLAVVDNTEQMCTCQRCHLLRSVASEFTCHACRKSTTVHRLCQYILHNRNVPLPIQFTAIIFGELLFTMGPSQLSRISIHGTMDHVGVEDISKLYITKRNSYT